MRASPRSSLSLWPLSGLALLAASVGFSACDSNPEFLNQGALANEGEKGSDSGDNGDIGALGGAFGNNNDDGGSSSGDPETCADSNETADLVPSNLLFVVDKSGSMRCADDEPTCTDPPSPAVSPNRWSVTRDALVGEDDPATGDVDETGAVRALEGSVGLSAGLILFPLTSTDSNCQLPESGELTTEIAALNGAHLAGFESALAAPASGSTPLVGAILRGYEALRLRLDPERVKDRPDGALAIEGDHYLVVMTDGAETCQEAMIPALLEEVSRAREVFGIETFAIGAPGSEQSRALLSEIAKRGGTADSQSCSAGGDEAEVGDCHVDLTESDSFASDLRDVFRNITKKTELTCEFDVPQNALVNLERVNVSYTPGDGSKKVEVLQDASRDCTEDAEGWQFTSDNKQIVLCGDICDEVRNDPSGKVEVAFGCTKTVIR